MVHIPALQRDHYPVSKVQRTGIHDTMTLAPAAVNLAVQARYLFCAQIKKRCFNEVGFGTDIRRDFFRDGEIIFGFS